MGSEQQRFCGAPLPLAPFGSAVLTSDRKPKAIIRGVNEVQSIL